MRWPSEMVGDFADKLEGMEDAAYDRYVGARAWLGGFKVWEWHEQQQTIDDLRAKNRTLVKEYKKLYDAYRARTGEDPPTEFVPIFADHEGIERAMGRLREALAKLTAPNFGRR